MSCLSLAASVDRVYSIQTLKHQFNLIHNGGKQASLDLFKYTLQIRNITWIMSLHTQKEMSIIFNVGEQLNNNILMIYIYRALIFVALDIHRKQKYTNLELYTDILDTNL